MTAHVLGIAGTRFTLDGQPFHFQGVSFFNALYNPALNQSMTRRREALQRLHEYGVTALRLWGQWNPPDEAGRRFVDAGPDSTLYGDDGSLRAREARRLEELCAAADELGMVIQLTCFAGMTWPYWALEAQDRAVRETTRLLVPFRNVLLQIWNECSLHTVRHLVTIKDLDPLRLVTSNEFGPGHQYRGEILWALDSLTPHTPRRGAHWQLAAEMVRQLLEAYRKPVIDDEPARNGYAGYGGPDHETQPEEHIRQIDLVHAAGGYHTYHHGMYHMGYGHPDTPPDAIPDPTYSPYHRRVFEHLRAVSQRPTT